MISIHVRAWWWICHRAQFSSTEHKHGKCTPHWNKHTHTWTHTHHYGGKKKVPCQHLLFYSKCCQR